MPSSLTCWSDAEQLEAESFTSYVKKNAGNVKNNEHNWRQTTAKLIFPISTSDGVGIMQECVVGWFQRGAGGAGRAESASALRGVAATRVGAT